MGWCQYLCLQYGWRIMANHDELLTLPQVLKELGGVSRRTFYRWRQLGRAPVCIQLPNLELRIWRSDLIAWLESRREAP
ncbi:helix-turn-helix transcriptional regulator [Nonomuraea sp. NPDC002799]